MGLTKRSFSGINIKMKKLLLSFVFFPLFLPVLSFSSIKNVVESSGDVTVINSTEVEAEGSNARTESSVSTTVNGENVTVKTNQPGSVEVRNVNGKVEIKTSQGITPTIIITGVSGREVEIEEKGKKEDKQTFSKIINNRTSSIYFFLKGFLKRVFGSFLKKT